MSIKIPKVTVIGTCRVHLPFSYLSKKNKINLNNGGMGTFVHSIPEIQLRIDVLKNKANYLNDLADLQVVVRPETNLSPNDNFSLDDSDVVVIEISSLQLQLRNNIDQSRDPGTEHKGAQKNMAPSDTTRLDN